MTVTAAAPLVTVIVRTYNRPQMLVNALASVQAQQWRPLEAVVVNDGGAPLDGAALQDALGDVALNLQALPDNRGRAHAANVGIRAAQGRFVAFLDDDDILHPRHLATLAPALQTGEHTVAYGDVEMVFVERDADGHEVDGACSVFHDDFSLPALLIGNYIPLNALLFDAETLRNSGGFDEAFDLYEDWDLLIRLALQKPFVRVGGTVVARYNQWDALAQINRNDGGRMRAATLQVLAKHREHLDAPTLLEYRDHRDRMEAVLRRQLAEQSSRLTGLQQMLAEEQSRLVDRTARLSSSEALSQARDRHIRHLEQQMRDTAAAHAEALHHHRQRIAALDDEVARMRATRFWRLRERLRRGRDRLFPPGSLRRRLFDIGRRALAMARHEGVSQLARAAARRLGPTLRRLPTLARRARAVQRTFGTRAMLARVADHLLQSSPAVLPAAGVAAHEERYARWIARNETHGTASMQQALETLQRRPLISIVTPVYNVDPQWLHRCIESVRAQGYPHWQLCLHDDASTRDDTREALARWCGVDDRIVVTTSSHNGGISAASNAALAQARGEFVALLDNDDELAPHALLAVARLLDRHPDADLVYSDEDRITVGEDGRTRRHDPFFKPDWSPQLLFACMYTGHLSVYRRALVQELGGFRSAYDFSQDYDLALRVTERTDRIHHLDEVLYHWRTLPTSAAGGGKDFARASNIAALQAACDRRGYDAVAEALPAANRVHFRLPEPPPPVSVIIPTDSRKNVFNCITLLLAHTDYPAFEIVVVTNSELADEVLQAHDGDARVRVCRFDQPFNFSLKCNEGAAASCGEYLLFYNDDVEAVHGSWLEDMLGVFGRGCVGGVSPKLFYENDTIQYAGMITGVRGLVGTAFHTVPKDSGTYFNFVQSERDVSLLSGACLLMPRTVFDEIGGWDAERTPIMHSDIDLCCRIRERGYAMVYTPHAELRHIGHLSLKATDHLRERRKDKADTHLLKRWGQYMGRDPFHPGNMVDLLHHRGEQLYRVHIGRQEPALLHARDLLLVSHDFSLSGAPMLLLHLAEHFRRRGCFVTVMSPEDGELGAMLRQRGIPVIIDATLAEAPDEQTRKLMAAFDLIVANTIVAWPAVQAGRETQTPVLWLLHESHDGVALVSGDPRIARALAQADEVVFACDATRLLFQAFDGNQRFRVLPYGTRALEAPAQPAPPSEGLRLVQIGSMERRKGQDVLADALARLPPATKARLSVTMIGRPLRPDFVAQVAPQLDALPFVRHLGALPHEQVAGHIASADALVLPSRDEVFPVTIMEAMSLGKPVIATAVGGVPEMIRDGIDGLVVPPEDPAALAAAIERLAADPAWAGRMGASARARYVERFSIERFGDDMLELITRRLSGPAAAA